MRRAIGRLRLPGSPRLLDRDECLVVVSATAALSAAHDVSWRVAPDAPERDVPHLSESLARARRDGRVFLLPPGSRSWLDLRYAYPDTGYALALLLVWSYGASRHDGDEAGSGGHVASRCGTCGCCRRRTRTGCWLTWRPRWSGTTGPGR
ncbi:hypothetical protein ACGFI4_30115 [Micromonospora carbonacea]|uniref:hypothetical protein n=1 Tax=Micromonospora carbonacea TaxID=47853 RepID=UPI00371A9203